MSEKRKIIEDTCKSWIEAAISPGAITIGPSSERYRLRNQGIKFEELDFEDLEEAVICLSTVLLTKNIVSFIDEDHLLFWSWSAEIILSRSGQYFSQEEKDLRELFQAVVRTTLVKSRQSNKSINYNSYHLLLHANLLTAYLVFPLLEGLLKKTCSSYVSSSGKVLKDFSVPKKTYKQGDRCSNVGHYLHLLYSEVACPELKHTVDVIKNKVEEFQPEKHAFNTIFGWRNASLHGENTVPMVSGTILNLIIIICLDSFRENYEDIKQKAIAKMTLYLTLRDAGQVISRGTCLQMDDQFYPLFVDRVEGLTDLSGLDLKYAYLLNLDLTEAILRNLDLRGTDLSGMDFSGCDFTSSVLKGANLSYAKLTNANLTNVDLRDANLDNACLYKTNLDQTDLRGADLEWARSLSKEQLASAKIDHTTKLKPGLRDSP